MLGKKGEGTFSDVLKCQSIENGTYAACKKMKQHYERFQETYRILPVSRCDWWVKTWFKLAAWNK